jgi:RNA polymerase sigma-70 factor, ECF subfamily
MAKAVDEAAGEPIAGDHREGPVGVDHPTLRRLLIERYNELKLRLSRRLGSTDWAEEALHDTYLRLHGTEAVSQVANPTAYLFRAAFNTALNRQRAEKRRLSAIDIETLLQIADDAPGAERVVEGRSDLALLKESMATLPSRQRSILLAARLEGLTRQQIAARFGISVSMVEKELKSAQERCVTAFIQKKVAR